MGDRVVHVQEIELVRQHHFVHADREREIVWRILEQRIAPDVDLVKVDARQKRRETKRLLIRDEVDLMAATRQRHAKLRCDGTGAAVRRIAGDADLHADRRMLSLSQRSATDIHD